MALLLGVVAAATLYSVMTTSSGVHYVKSTVDGHSYLVLRRSDSRDAANLLAVITNDLSGLVAHMHNKFPDDADVQRLKAGYNPRVVSEGSPSSGYTSYTIDKGVRMVLCMRQTDGSFVPKNVIMYVAIHELAHVMTKQVGHEDVFWKNNARLLNEAQTIGLYRDMDLSKAPQPYCGMHIDG